MANDRRSTDDDYKNEPIMADQAQASLDPQINRVYMLQQGVDRQPDYSPISRQGPYYNVGGNRHVSRGNQTYLDFYTDKK